MLQVQMLIYQPHILLEEYVHCLLLGTKLTNRLTVSIICSLVGHSSHCCSENKSQNQVLLKNNFEIPGTGESTLCIAMLKPSRHFLYVQNLITAFVYKDIGLLNISTHCVYSYTVKVKGKVHPRTGHKGPE